jgi:ankyrin repeat protein
MPEFGVPLVSFVCGRSPKDFESCLGEYLKLLTLVFEGNPNLWIMDKKGWTCLHYAARVGNSYAVSAIL